MNIEFVAGDDLIGKRFTRIVVLEKVPFISKVRRTKFKCRCDCGAIGFWEKKALTSGNTKSCGCLKLERTAQIFKTHGLSKSKFYMVFYGMINRCVHPRNSHYYLYGARGIKVEWATFEDFKKDMYESYLAHCKEYGQKDTQIEREDSNGNYNKQNCRWATRIEQASNTSRSHFIQYRGEKKTISQWCRDLGISREMVKSRLSRGWKDEDALTIPPLGYKKIYHRGKHNKSYVH